jgi:tRNA-binding protein
LVESVELVELVELVYLGKFGIMQEISWNDFEKIELRVGKVMEVKDFPEARKPAFIVTVDFGNEIGIKKSSARVTDHYSKEELLGKQIVGVVNFPVKQIGPFKSEFLLTGFYQKDGSVILAVPEREAELGSRLG